MLKRLQLVCFSALVCSCLHQTSDKVSDQLVTIASSKLKSQKESGNVIRVIVFYLVG